MLNKNKIEYYLIISFGNLLSIFSFKSIKYFSKFVAFIFFYIFPIRKKVVLKNLSIAFPEFDIKTRNKLAFKNYVNTAQAFLEIYYLNKLNKEEISSLVSPVGIEAIQENLDKGKGLILLTAHLGNWELGAIAAGILLNKSLNVLVKNQKNHYVSNVMKSIREKGGNKQIAVGKSVKELFAALKRGETIGIVGDQRGPRDGMRVEFFGRKTSTFIGTASLAIKNDCPVLIIFCARKPDGNFEFVIENHEYDKNLPTKEEQIISFNQNYFNILEKIIRKYPEQWLWMHNIWKY
jgi:Kdo2-lipid IVA lauroyltransferase/acyltransferase